MPWYNDLRPAEDHIDSYYSQVFPKLKDSDRKRIIKKPTEIKTRA